jgi:hypothetical protein
MRGAIPPIPPYVFMAWCLVKHRDKFTFTFKEIGIDEANWIRLAQDKDKWLDFVNTVMNFRVP